jgi:hypothetical protein
MAKRGGDERNNRGIAALTNCQALACLIFPLHRQLEILIGYKTINILITLKPITQLALYCKQTFAEINIY